MSRVTSELRLICFLPLDEFLSLESYNHFPKIHIKNVNTLFLTNAHINMYIRWCMHPWIVLIVHVLISYQNIYTLTAQLTAMHFCLGACMSVHELPAGMRYVRISLTITLILMLLYSIIYFF